MEEPENKDKIKEDNILPRNEKIQSLEIMHKQENEKGEEEEDEYEDYQPRLKTVHNNNRIKKFFSIFSRKTEKSVIIEEDLRNTEGSINDPSETSKKKKKKRKNILEKIPLECLQLITILMIIVYIIVALVSLIVFYVQRKDKKPFLFCFNFIKREDFEEGYGKYDTILFLTDLNSFCIIHYILLIIFIKILYTFFTNQTRDIKNFFKDFSIYFDLTLLVNIPFFFLGIISDYKGNNEWKIIFFIILTGIGTLSSFKMYLQTKYNKYKNLTRLINQGILSGVLASFELYCLMHSICAIVTWGTGTDIDDAMEIIPGSIYFIFCFFFIFFYKDIIFPITALILEIGLLYLKKSNDIEVSSFNLSVVAFNFSTIIITIFKYNKLVFVPLEAIQSHKINNKNIKKKKK
jgi:hypothetical protein